MTGFSEEKLGRGRPREIEDDALRRMLIELQFVLELNWGLIGWELHQAKTLGDIRAAFNAIKGINCPKLDLFRQHPTQRTTPAALRQLRKEMAHSQNTCRHTYAAYISSRESVERASQAFVLASDEATLTSFQHLQADLAKRHEATDAALEGSKARSRELQSKLDQQEAWFAQSQLGSFIHSARWEYTPLNVAMAMAGMPRLSARVSCERCSGLKGTFKHGLTYQMFQAVEAVFAHPPVAAIEGPEQMRTYLIDPRRRKQIHIAELRKNWYFLKCAIESTRASELPRGALPYRIFAAYQRRFHVQTQSDILFARVSRL